MQGLDVFMAGDDVKEKKPNPSIYTIAASRLQVEPSECLVVEDSTIGLQVWLQQHTEVTEVDDDVLYRMLCCRQPKLLV